MKSDQELSPRNRPAMAENTQERGRLYRTLSKVCIGIFLVLLIFFYSDTYPGFNEITGASGTIPMPVLLFLSVFSILGAIMLSKKGRRHSAPRYVELDDPPGVLYLRPFTEDTDWKVYYSWGSDRVNTSFRDKLTVFRFQLRMELDKIRKQTSWEFGEILSALTSDFGKMAAIGEPGSPPILGADNVYVSDANWKEKVRGMAEGAELVILTAGTTPGVLWETENMINLVPPERLVLNIPGGTPARRRKNYKEFKKVADSMFPRGLPERLNARVLTFDPDWEPVLDRKPKPAKGTSAHVAWWMSRVLP